MDLLPIVRATAIVLTMASMDNAEKTIPTQNLKTDPEKASSRPESDLGGETERDPEDAREPTPGDNSGNAPKVEDAGPPDGGTAAWLAVLGAWCCSFSSPGWVNSKYFLLPYTFPSCCT